MTAVKGFRPEINFRDLGGYTAIDGRAVIHTAGFPRSPVVGSVSDFVRIFGKHDHLAPAFPHRRNSGKYTVSVYDVLIPVKVLFQSFIDKGNLIIPGHIFGSGLPAYIDNHGFCRVFGKEFLQNLHNIVQRPLRAGSIGKKAHIHIDDPE